MSAPFIAVTEAGSELRFGFDDLMRYHGPGFPGGVAHAFQAMRAGFALLSDSPPERRRLAVVTAFTGPGGRDAVEMVTRALTDGRMTVDRSLGGAGNVIEAPPGPYLWRFGLGPRWVEVTIRPGHVRPEFIALGSKSGRSPEEEERLTFLKGEMAGRLIALAPHEVYEARAIAP